MRTEQIYPRSVLALVGTVTLALGLGLGRPAAAQTVPLFKVNGLISDIPYVAQVTDPLLRNPWGVAFSATSPIWTSNAGSTSSTVYTINATTGATTKAALTVTMPAQPTGQVFNGVATDFIVTANGASGSANFIFSTLGGTIFGRAGTVNSGTIAALAATGASGSSYTGLTIGSRNGSQVLYAANNGLGKIDAFDNKFAAAALPGNFSDPNLPAGNKPFNVANINNTLYVTYEGPLGTTNVVNAFNLDGGFVKRVATGGTLFNPWGIALAPSDFPGFPGDLLVGNFNSGFAALGPGTISAFNATTGAFDGLLKGTSNNPISIDGLWALWFGTGGSSGAKNVLYFAAGINGQQDGLIGALAP